MMHIIYPSISNHSELYFYKEVKWNCSQNRHAGTATLQNHCADSDIVLLVFMNTYTCMDKRTKCLQVIYFTNRFLNIAVYMYECAFYDIHQCNAGCCDLQLQFKTESFYLVFISSCCTLNINASKVMNIYIWKIWVSWNWGFRILIQMTCLCSWLNKPSVIELWSLKCISFSFYSPIIFILLSNNFYFILQ